MLHVPFFISESLYEYWDVASFSDSSIAAYVESDGQIRIKQSGLYLLYAQVKNMTKAFPVRNFCDNPFL